MMQPSVAMESDASHMLEAALEQMDDIIAGSKAAAEYSNGLFELGSPSSCGPGPLAVLRLAEDLRLALELLASQEDRDSLRAQIPCSTAHTLMHWLDTREVNLRSPVSNETYQERLVRLEGDKESLVLQVSVLTDQVEAQGEKIRDLESSLEEHHHKLVSTEEMLQQELVSRTSLEGQKLDLMDEVSYLKLKLVGRDEEVERPAAAPGEEQPDQQAAHDKQNKAEGLLQELRLLKSKVDELEGEKSQYERKLKATKAEILDLQQLLASKDTEIESLQSQLVARGPSNHDSTDKDQEFHRLKVGMESLLASNDAKDRHIEELTVLLGQYRRMKEMVALTQQATGDRLLCGSSEEELSGSLKMRALTHKAHSDIIRSEMSSRGSSPLLVSPSSFQRGMDSSCRSFQTSMETSLVSPGDAGYHNAAWSEPRLLSSSLEELQSGSLPKNRHLEMNKYQTLPGKLSRSVMNGEREREKYSSPVQLSPVENHDSDYNLRRPERLDETTLSDLSPLSSGVESGQQSPVSPENRKSTRGIRKLWGKIRRSQSGSLQGEDPDLAEFRRGGFRATAGPRLARTGDTSLRDLKTPFSKWTTEQVCDWLEEFGLGQYVILARHWLTSGQTLLSATPQDLEKELGIKNPLHRKKVQLAVKSLSARHAEKSSELDHLWVTRWLDDIGLPQYKDQFNEARVDGRVLQYLTVNDLLFLKVTSQLHHLSIKCAIHVLHVNKFNPHCLKRRPGDETSPSEVVQWSNHRVMEWLRSVDLAEYAPNLRGSGVHGGLIILEPRFNSDTLAMLLNIPPQKTLLRRHLATNFSSLVGPSAQLEKRDYMESPGYAPLSTTAKVKPKKLGFSHLRRKRADDSTDFICPLESHAQAPPQANGAQRPYTGFRGLSPILDRDPDRREQMLITEGTVLRIEALSEGINNLTYLLSRDEVLKEMRRSRTALV